MCVGFAACWANTAARDRGEVTPVNLCGKGPRDGRALIVVARHVIAHHDGCKSGYDHGRPGATVATQNRRVLVMLQSVLYGHFLRRLQCPRDVLVVSLIFSNSTSGRPVNALGLLMLPEAAIDVSPVSACNLIVRPDRIDGLGYMAPLRLIVWKAAGSLRSQPRERGRPSQRSGEPYRLTVVTLCDLGLGRRYFYYWKGQRLT